jgi:glycosyltransferase involved in cell wall biosynthesis
LERAVSSVLIQTVGDFECIVVVDGGEDDFGELPEDDRVLVVRRPVRGGAAAARNDGMRTARGRFVTFLDDDDELLPDRLALARAALARAPIALCWRAVSEAGELRVTWKGRLEGDLTDRILESPVPHVGQVALPLQAAPFFDERFEVSEDVEWWLRCARIGIASTEREVGYMLHSHAGPRQTARLDARINARLLLLEMHESYFKKRPRAAAYQWKRLGGMAHTAGDHQLARRAFLRSLRLQPQPSTFLRLMGA